MCVLAGGFVLAYFWACVQLLLTGATWLRRARNVAQVLPRGVRQVSSRAPRVPRVGRSPVGKARGVTAARPPDPSLAPHHYVWSDKMSRARVYADVNVKRPREYWDYENLQVTWGCVVCAAELGCVFATRFLSVQELTTSCRVRSQGARRL